MAGLQSMTLEERMNDINGDGLHEYTFQEACNKMLEAKGTVNGVNYSGIGLNDYTPEEVFAIIRHKTDLREKNLTELINEMGGYGAHEYTATESLNKQDAITEAS